MKIAEYIPIRLYRLFDHPEFVPKEFYSLISKNEIHFDRVPFIYLYRNFNGICEDLIMNNFCWYNTKIKLLDDNTCKVTIERILYNSAGCEYLTIYEAIDDPFNREKGIYVMVETMSKGDSSKPVILPYKIKIGGRLNGQQSI